MPREREWIIKLAPDQQLLFPNCSDFSRNWHQSPDVAVACPLLLNSGKLLKVIWIWLCPRTEEQQERALICVWAALDCGRPVAWGVCAVPPLAGSRAQPSPAVPQVSTGAFVCSCSWCRAAPSSRQGRAGEPQTITPFTALTVFLSQQVFNPNLSLSEWNLTEMEASLSPVRDVYFWDVIITIIEPQNGRGGSNLNVHPVPTPLPTAGTPSPRSACLNNNGTMKQSLCRSEEGVS